MTYQTFFLIVILGPIQGLAPAALTLPERHSNPRGQDKEDGGIAAVNLPSIEVRKTATVNGHQVCGVISVKNTGRETVSVAAIADSLEVHFPSGVDSGGLPAGSTAKWYKVADVPIVLPGPIAPRATVHIDYCFSLCLTADAPGANSMRNVVTVRATNSAGAVRSFTTRSVSFPPPALDCQACCLDDGFCQNKIPSECADAGGLSGGPGTRCTNFECAQACCLPDGSCISPTLATCRALGGEPQGLGSDCANTTCRGACCADSVLGCIDGYSVESCRNVLGTYLGNDTTCAAAANW